VSSESPISQGQNEIEDHRPGPGEQLRDILQPEMAQRDKHRQEQEYRAGNQ
jgi:hypothetical protein